MGTITKIRQVSPYVFVVFAVLFIGFMVLSDNISNLATSGGESMQTAAVGEVNGEKIYYSEFEEKVKIRIEQMRNDPQNESKEIDEQNVRAQVWDEMLREKLLEQAGKKFGINVSNDEILDILIDNPPDYLKSSFTDSSGVFNRDLYLKIVTNPETIVNYIGQDPSTIDAETRNKYVSDFRNQLIVITDYLKIQKINDAVTNTLNAAYAISSPTFVEQRFVDDNSNANINYISIPISSITDSIAVSDDEMKTYFEKHKNEFKVKNERKVKTLIFPVVASADDSVRTSKRIERMLSDIDAANTVEEKDSVFTVLVNEYTGVENDWQLMQDLNPQISSLFTNAKEKDIIGPIALPDGTHFYRLDGRRNGEQEVVKASHILISFNNNKDSAKAFVNNLLKKTNSSNFAEMAKEYSEDKGSGSQGGDLGYFGKGRMVPEFENAAFGAKVGAIVGPIESQFGYHIIKVDDKRSDELKYSEITLQISVSGNTHNKVKRDAFAAMKQLKDGMNIDTLAVRLKIDVNESQYMTKTRPFYGSMYLTNKVFESKLNEVLEPKEIGNGATVVVVQLAGIRKSGIGTFEDDSAQIRQRLIKIKKLDLAKKRAQEVYNIVKAGGTLEGIVEGLPYELTVTNATIKNNGDMAGAQPDFAATMQAFKLPTNKINEPVRCENAYFILEIKSREIPTADKAKDAQDLTKMQYTRSLFNIWFEKFKENQDIVDYRGKYYQDF